jgi:hypothetical protein
LYLHYHLARGVGALDVPGAGHPVVGLVELALLGGEQRQYGVEGPVAEGSLWYAEFSSADDEVVAYLHGVAVSPDLLADYLEVLHVGFLVSGRV